MKIICLNAENVKRLTAVEIKPDGNLVIVSGKNGAGKTSVLDSLWWALAGASHIQAAPIRKGAKSARIRLDLGEIVVTRTFSRGKGEDEKTTTALTVESADGATYRSPQKMLDELIGALSFDPLAFARAKPAEQVETLKRFVPDVDFDAIDKANAADYEKRRDVNRRAKELRAQLQALTVPGDPRAERVDESALVAKLEEAGERNAEIERRKAKREKLARDAERAKESAAARLDEIARLEALIEEARTEAKTFVDEAAEIEAALASAEALPAPIDTAGIREQIAAARETNRAVDERERVIAETKRLEGETDKAEAESEQLTRSMEQRNTEKAKAIADANLPIAGLAFGSGEVTLAGVPFEQASDAEQLRASVAIAAALNPKLRVIRIRDGSLLDEDGLKLVAEMADAQDMQVWCERVDSSGKVGVYIEDGAVKQQEREA